MMKTDLQRLSPVQSSQMTVLENEKCVCVATDKAINLTLVVIGQAVVGGAL